ncbi:MAG: tetratricopeptide (TPR) repeat protein [Candidatus Paceibacteria bacterium]
MAIRQEQIVLIGTALLLGYFVITTGGESRRSTSSKAQAPEFEDHYAPDVNLAKPLVREVSALERDLFTAPSDTRPFPPLQFESPLLQPLDVLRPTPSAGPQASLLGRFLRREKQVQDMPDLFLDQETSSDQEATDEFAVDAGMDESLMTSEEKQARLAIYRANYDWIDMGSVHYGFIQNADRFGLKDRTKESVEFVEVIPGTGVERWPNQEPIIYERERVKAFEFAGTLDNRIELERLEFASTLTVGQYPKAIEFAFRCFLLRHESALALDVAEEMFSKAIQVVGDDPEPELGVAACAEARFEFERAFGIYEGLVKGKFGDHPEVLARLAQLENRFRLTARAREHFEMAEGFGRTSWLVQWHFGRFLLSIGDPEGALDHLRLAVEFEPKRAEFTGTRALIRTDYADALVAVGQLDEARALYTRALQVNEEAQRAIAGLLNVDYLQGTASSGAEGLGIEGTEGAEFELLVALGLQALDAGDYEIAKERLQLAASADPLRAYQPWRALSYLAEVSGNASEALEYIERAEANNPSDVYSLFQRGRILAQSGDADGAMESLRKALDLELDLADALAAIGRLEMEAGNYEAAERFLERATSVDSGLAPAFTTRGLNDLHMDRAESARGHFEQALVLASTDPVAALGQAWCAYSLGDPTEAKTLLREFEDSRRNLGEEDPYRLYALAQIERIGEWEQKVVWTDNFERQDLRNGWLVDEVTDTQHFMRDGSVVLEGTFDKSGRTRLRRTYTSGDFVSLEAKITINSANTVRAGIFVALEQRRGSRSTNQTTAEITLSRHGIEKQPQYRSMKRGREDAEYVDSTVMSWADGQTVTLRLERYGESSKTAFRVSLDGVLIAERVPMPSIGSTTREIVVGIFAEGEPGRTVSIQVDDVEVVKRER